MSSIHNHLFDREFLDLSLHYLSDTLKLKVTVLNSDRQPILEKGPADCKVERYYPFHFPTNIGGFTCGTSDQETLQRAEPHISYCLAAINSQLLRELELRETSEEMLRLSSQLSFLSKVARKISGVEELEECYRIILQEIAGAIKAEQSFIQSSGRWDESIDPQVGGGHGRIMVTSNPAGDSVLYAQIREKDNRVSDRMVFIRPAGQPPFTSYEKKFVGIIEQITSPTFETLRLYDSLQSLYLNTVKALAAAIDAKDEYTHGHSFRVAKYAVAIGRQMSLASKETNDLEIAAYMHDLGKIGVSEQILGKSDRLTAEEFGKIKQHPEFTDRILQPICLEPHIIQGAIQHHERLDGSGYPLGLQGSDISLFGRIISVADVFDALTSERPYRAAISVETALRILANDIERRFDRDATLALIQALQQRMPTSKLQELNSSLRFDEPHNLNQFLSELAELVAALPSR